MLTAVIADDEPLARRRIRTLLRPHADVNVLLECGDGRATMEAIRTLSPTLLFLDVEMPEIDGFGVLAAVETVPAVIFVTAHTQYAVAAFEAQALDYLLKPFLKARFEEALERARNRIRELQILNKLRAASVDRSLLIIRADGRIVFLQRSEIECVEAERDYVHIFAGGKEYLIRESLSSIAGRLDERFLRVHRSAVVNLAHICEVQPRFAGDAKLILLSGRQIVLSRTHRRSFDAFMERTRAENCPIRTGS